MARFIEPSYKIISDDFSRDKVLKRIEKAARTCYQSEGKICEGSDVRLLNKLVELGHEAMIEHAPNLSVTFTTCRGVSHELVRHRLASFAQESTRYVKYGKDDEDMVFILPPWITGTDRDIILNKLSWSNSDIYRPDTGLSEIAQKLTTEAAIFVQSCTQAEKDYAALIEFGWKPQQAREILPNAIKTEIVVTADVREWRHMFELRCDKPAHPQMRELMIPLYNQLKCDIPELWGDIEKKIDINI
jgi:thymidylate synthase (FAD)